MRYKKCPNCDGTGCENGVACAERVCTDCKGKGRILDTTESEEWAKKRAEFDRKRTEDGQKVLETLTRLTKKYPYHRIGQFISNATHGKEWNDLFYLENDRLLGWLLEFEILMDESKAKSDGN